MKKREITFKHWVEMGEALFGKDRGNWEFVCPICKTTSSFLDFIKEGASIKDASFWTGSRCIGTIIRKRGCSNDKVHDYVVLIDDVKKGRFKFKGESWK